MTRQTYKYISISVALLTSIATITFIYFLRKNKIQNPSNVLKEAQILLYDVKGSFILHEPYVDDNLYPKQINLSRWHNSN